MKHPARSAVIAVAFAVLGLMMAWLAGFFSPKIDGGVSVPPALVAVASVPVVRETVPSFEHATGTVEAKNETLIAARIIATVRSVSVRAGDWVEAGQVLVELDQREQRARVEQSAQAIATAEARLAEARAHHARTVRLADQRAASQSEIERALASLRGAEAELARAREALSESASARSHATIIAPLAGRVVERYAEPGDTAMPGAPLLRLYNPQTLRLEASVRESLAAGLAVGTELEVLIDAAGVKVQAPIEEVVPSADPGSRSFVVKLPLPARPGLYPGMFGRLAIPTGTVLRIRVPAAAVKRVGQLEYVLLTDSAAGVVRRFVRTTGIADHGMLEVLSGLSGDERVVIDETEPAP